MENQKGEIELQGSFLGQKAKVSNKISIPATTSLVLFALWALAIYSFDISGAGSPEAHARLLVLTIGISFALGGSVGFWVKSQRCEELLSLIAEKDREIERLANERNRLQDLQTQLSSTKQPKKKGG